MKSEFQTLAQYIDFLQSRGQYSFTKRDAIEALNCSNENFKQMAHRLTSKNRITRVHADFFNLIPIEYAHTGSLPASWFIHKFMQHLAADYYVSLLSAAAIHGAAHQQPMTFQIICTRKLTNITLGNQSIEFHYRQTIDPTCFQSIKTETGSMNVATPEVTLCDCLQYIHATGFIHNVATVLLELQEKIDMTHLLSYIKKGYLALVNVQRLGFLIEHFELPLPTDKLYQWLITQPTQCRPLVPSNPITTIKNKKWKIIINESLEPDEL